MATVLVQDALANWTEADGLRDRGAVFTPDFLADWVASLLREKCDLARPTIADFGCGSGNLLSAAADHFPSNNLVGVELDGPSAALAQRLIGRAANILVDDFLSPSSAGAMPLGTYWMRRLGTRPDVLIMNPPWGADHTLSKLEALRTGLTFASGQFDTYDLFCELALQILRPGGSYGFIIPDSLFLPEHERLRKLLANETTISLIARLGEGIFPGVYRGCVVITGWSEPPKASHQVECIRLTKAHRQSLRDGKSLEACRKETAHLVPQVRFIENPQHRFDIDVAITDETITRVLQSGGDWIAPLNSRRGVELSKSGRVVICHSCGAARPQPKGVSPECFQCAAKLVSDTQVIVAQQAGAEGVWRPFIAGEDVCRYNARSRRWIRTDLRGINYKSPHPQGTPRILIRKTGIGLNAALDSSGALTNQVVFEYALNPGAIFDFSYLHYVLGVLCSRVLFAVHLKRGGDLEWRSHPYVTQKTLAELPIPLPREHTREWHQAAAIAGAVEAHLSGKASDLHIEALVAGLYGLSGDDMQWVADVLSGAGNLEAIKNLRLPVDHGIEPITVH